VRQARDGERIDDARRTSSALDSDVVVIDDAEGRPRSPA
jgi:hypothetical protein